MKESVESKLAKDVKEIQQKAPEKLAQPTLKIDRLNGGKEKVDDAFFKLYGNPFNNSPEGKKNQFLEEPTEIDKYNAEQEEKYKSQFSPENMKKMALYHFQRGYNPESVQQDINLLSSKEYMQCNYCTAINMARKSHCWNCLQSI